MNDGIWDDGEWISWETINDYLDRREAEEIFPLASYDSVLLFRELVRISKSYYESTGRYLQIWGELGELYGEVKFGIDRHRPGTAGSDGRIGNDWVEIKTISPEKNKQSVVVKKSGNFNKLLIVAIDNEFNFTDRMVCRSELNSCGRKYFSYSW